MLKHTIEGTKEETFDDQEESDAVIEDLEVLAGVIREELHLAAENKGSMIGPLLFNDMGDDINRRQALDAFLVPYGEQGILRDPPHIEMALRIS